MTDTPHQCFTARSTAYVRNLTKEDRQEEFFAVHYQRPPKDFGNGHKSIGLIAPLLIVSLYMDEQKAIADKVARILNAHWDDPAFADQPGGAAA